VICEHRRTADSCQDCALRRAETHGLAHGVPLVVVEAPERERAEDDLLLEAGDGRSVFVAAGDPIPLDLLDAARQPAPYTRPGAPPPARRKRGA